MFYSPGHGILLLLISIVTKSRSYCLCVIVICIATCYCTHFQFKSYSSWDGHLHVNEQPFLLTISLCALEWSLATCWIDFLLGILCSSCLREIFIIRNWIWLSRPISKEGSWLVFRHSVGLVSVTIEPSFVNTQLIKLQAYDVFRSKMKATHSCSFSGLIKVKCLISGENLEDGSKTLMARHINNRSPFAGKWLDMGFLQRNKP